MESDKFQSVELRKYNGPVAGVKVLVVDADSTCRAIISKMLRSLGYEVVTATLASDALSIIEEKKDELNLVLVEARLPDMEIYELTEKMRESSDLPSFIMTADDNQPSISRALCKGAKLCFRKPVQISDLRDLWRFAMWNRNRTIASEEVPGFGWHLSEAILVNDGPECHTSMNTGNQSLQSAEGKEQELLDRDNGGESVLKRKRVSWTDDLQTKFLEAVELAGVNARPKKIYELMNVPGLTKENVSNYLQKYRQSMKRANAIQQHENGYLSLTDNDCGKRPLFLEQQGVTNNPAFWGNNQKDLSNCMSVQFLGPPAHFPSQENSSGQNSSFWQNQLCPPLKLQGVAHTTSGFGEFMNNVNGEASANISQVKNTADGKVFNEDTFLSPAYSTAGQHEMHFSRLLANDLYQQFSPQLPVALLPSGEKEHGIFGAEAGKIDEIFYSKGTQQFSDEDLNMWLSRFNSRPL